MRHGLSAYDVLVGTARHDDGGWVVTRGEPKPDNLLATPPVARSSSTGTPLRSSRPARDLWMGDGDPAEQTADTEIAWRGLTGYVAELG